MASPAAVRNAAVDAVEVAPWRASLALRVGLRGGHCRLLHNRHEGPLRLQRLLHPQGPQAAEALLLHPPGGIAGGDELAIDIAVGEGARLLVTTPGAAKWYRCESAGARQSIALTVEAGAALEWLPQESILFEGSRAEQRLTIDLADDARMIGWDIVQLGRLAAREHWRSGCWQQCLTLRRDARAVWLEQARLDAGSPLHDAAQGLAGLPVFGTLWACAPALAQPDVLEPLRAELDSMLARRIGAHRLQTAATWLPPPRGVLLVRALAEDAGVLRDVLEHAWAILRGNVIGLDAQRPRIWST